MKVDHSKHGQKTMEITGKVQQEEKKTTKGTKQPGKESSDLPYGNEVHTNSSFSADEM